MTEAVAVPVLKVEEPQVPRVKSATNEAQVIDEGLDLSGYVGTHGKPFVADYFNVADLYKTNSDVKEMVDGITQHLIDKSPGESLVYVVKDMLDKYVAEMNLKDNDAGLYRLKRVKKIIDLKAQLAQLEAMKDKVARDIDAEV